MDPCLRREDILFETATRRLSCEGRNPLFGTNMTLITREATWSDDKDTLREIRKVVFIQEQNVPKELEWDDRDTECWHVLIELDGKAVATGRIDTDGKIGRMAVLKEARGQNIGVAVLDQLKSIARREGITKTYMHAQCHAIDFYLKNGYRAIGDVYDEAGIAHQNAEEILYVESLTFTDAVALFIESIENASKHVLIKLTDINHPLLCHSGFVSTLKLKCLNERRLKISILLENTRPNKRSDEFVRHYQRLSDKISIRTYKTKQSEPDRRQFLIVDNQFIAWQTSPDYSDFRILRASNRISSFKGDFETAWSNSERDLSLLKLYI